jgi:glycine/D-amino acid oxidase-like deaminating enzyme
MPILNKTGYFGLCSMSGGLRVSGTVEIAGLDAPPTMKRAENLVRQAQRLFPSLTFGEPSYWMGHRPSTPDSLPVIGRLDCYEGLYACFGHGHAGLTGAPASGLLLAQMIAGERPSFDPAPYAASRFGNWAANAVMTRQSRSQDQGASAVDIGPHGRDQWRRAAGRASSGSRPSDGAADGST